MNIEIAESIVDQAKKALSFYPELFTVSIEFRFKKDMNSPTMLAQPRKSSFFKPRSQRSYIILISEKSKIFKKQCRTEDLPTDVLIGWFGHELGHILDYQTLSNWQLILFGIKYLFSENHKKRIERRADQNAVKHGMRNYILKMKNFILNHPDISSSYKNHVRNFYLSPDEIEQLAIDEK